MDQNQIITKHVKKILVYKSHRYVMIKKEHNYNDPKQCKGSKLEIKMKLAIKLEIE